MLSFPILQHLERLQRAHNVHRIHCRLLTDLCINKYYNGENHVCVLCLQIPSLPVVINLSQPTNRVFIILTAVKWYCLTSVFSLTFDGDLFALEVVHVSEQHFLPVTTVTDEAQVRQGSLR